MTSIIKNQILKHLSKFAKNLTSDKINISTMRGRGEMKSLELDEAVITDLLELPVWMRISRVWCNHVVVYIHWTRLKSEPICVELDTVQVHVETCEELRPCAASGSSATRLSSGQYGFSDKVIDGMTVKVNCCNIRFSSHAFESTVELTTMCVQSVTPNWNVGDNLRQTRVRTADRCNVLLYKELSWQAVRVEARSTRDTTLTPLRLINNQARCRIVIKKRIADCSVVACRLALLMNSLLWVLTDGQLKAALLFSQSLAGLIARATRLSQRVKAVRKLESFRSDSLAHDTNEGVSSGQGGIGAASSAKSGGKSDKDVLETSYHFCSNLIDLHFSDDAGEGRSSAPELGSGGALRLQLERVQVDYYPYHMAYGSRSHWSNYGASVPEVWLRDSLTEFRQRLLATLLGISSQHAPLTRAPPLRPTSGLTSVPPGGSVEQQRVLAQLQRLMTSAVSVRLQDFSLYQLSSRHRRTNLQSFVSGDNQRMKLPEDVPCIHMEFMYFYYPGNVDFPLPPPQVMLHANPIRVVFDHLTLVWLNAFLCNIQRCIPASGASGATGTTSASGVTGTAAASTASPSSAAASAAGDASMTPPTSCRGLATPPLGGAAVAASAVAGSGGMCVDVRVEAIMPCVELRAESDPPSNQRDRPSSLLLHMTRLLVTNRRSHDPLHASSLSSLSNCLDQIQNGSLASGSQFPSRDSDLQILPERLILHTQGRDHVYSGHSNASTPSTGHATSSSSSPRRASQQNQQQLLWYEPRDVFCLHVDPVWLEFGGTAVTRRRPVPLLDPMPVTMWVVGSRQRSAVVNAGVAADLTLVVHAPSVRLQPGDARDSGCMTSASTPQFSHQPPPISLQLNHYQYLFLLRQMERLGETSVRMALDRERLLGAADGAAASVCVTGVVPRIDVSLLMEPVQISPERCSVGDLSSVMAEDSISLNSMQFQTSFDAVPAEGSTEQQSRPMVARSVSPMFAGRVRTGSGSNASSPLTLRRDPSSKGSASLTSLGTSGSAGSSAGSGLSGIKSTVINNSASALFNVCKRLVHKDSVGGGGEAASGGSSSCSTLDSHNVSATGRAHSPHFTTDSVRARLVDGHRAAECHQVKPSVSGELRNLQPAGDSPPMLNHSPSPNCNRSADSPDPGAGGGSLRRVASGQLGTRFVRGFSTLMMPRGTATGTTVTSVSMHDNLDSVSDMSSDSDSYILRMSDSDTADSRDPMMVVRGWLESSSVELACEAIDEVRSEGSASSMPKLRRLISAFTIRLGGAEFVYQSCGFDTAIKFSCRHLLTEQCGSISWDEFQSKFQQRSRNWSDMDFSAKPCTLNVRLNSSFKPLPNQCNQKLDVRAQSVVLLEARIADLSLDLFTSTITNLVDLVEDERINPPVPMKVDLERIRLTVTDDRQATNITSPGSVPMKVYLSSLHVTLDKHGVLTVHPPCSSESSSTGDLKPTVRRTGSHRHRRNPAGENPTGTAPAADSEPCSDDWNRLLKRNKQLEERLKRTKNTEKQLKTLQERCQSAETRASALQLEKDSLMKKLLYLQEEFKKLDSLRYGNSSQH